LSEEPGKRHKPLLVFVIVLVVLALGLFFPLPLTATQSEACDASVDQCEDGGAASVVPSTNLYELLVRQFHQEENQ
jgi:hypothetical protein